MSATTFISIDSFSSTNRPMTKIKRIVMIYEKEGDRREILYAKNKAKLFNSRKIPFDVKLRIYDSVTKLTTYKDYNPNE